MVIMAFDTEVAQESRKQGFVLVIVNEPIDFKKSIYDEVLQKSFISPWARWAEKQQFLKSLRDEKLSN